MDTYHNITGTTKNYSLKASSDYVEVKYNDGEKYVYISEKLRNLCKEIVHRYKENRIRAGSTEAQRMQALSLIELTSEIEIHCPYEKAERKYNDEIINRKGLFLKETGILLHNVKLQADVCPNRIHALIKNLFRNVCMISLTGIIILFTSIPGIIEVDKLKLITGVFNILALYLLAFILFQSSRDIIRIIISKNELFYWRKITSTLFSENQIKLFISNPLKEVKKALYVTYPVMMMTYVLLAICCYNFVDILKFMEG